ncbi:Putative glycosyltransferase EpsF [Rubripirellula lacrimiformis]|uniref:Glycosyltransferase EpsF n=1 Tax=Rubripirellula lacrimiformis TaxID=1930273 RepID=A0A517N9F8_9BACT|nr:Putative glycosyltransferase EpsF [Rubripirellula lacrimiformis]
MLLTRSRPWRSIPSRSQAGPLRCLFVITSMPVGGAETLLVNMMRKMDPSVIRPEVVCLKEPGPLGETIADQFPVHSGLLSKKWDLRVLPRLATLMHRQRADVVVTVGAGDKMFWGRLAAHLAGVPVIMSALHSTGWPDGVGRLNRYLTGITDGFIGVADSHGEFLNEFEGFPESKVHVIRNGVDCQRFVASDADRASVREELGLGSDTPLIGLVAALRSEKNHSMLVRTAAALRSRHPDAHWVIVGDGPERATIEDLAETLGVADRIHMLGTRHDTPRLVAALDVFTLSSLNEASPVSILEALACEVPVVATDVGSIKESILPGKTGWLVPSQDLDAMVDRVDQLLSDSAMRRQMGKAGRDLVIRTGSLDSMVDGYTRLATLLYDQKVSRPVAALAATKSASA